MMRVAATIGALLLACATALGAGLGTAGSGARNTATVSVAIRVQPQAWIEFPQGSAFVLTVPEEKHKNYPAIILPVLIPFKVRGNAVAAVSAKPDEFIHIHAGPWLGEAVNKDDDTHRDHRGRGRWNTIGNGHHDGHDDAHHDSHDDGHHDAHNDSHHNDRHDDHHDSHDNGHHDAHKDSHHNDHHDGHHQDGGDTIGYNIIVQFPLQSWTGASVGGWDGFGHWRNGFASLPGIGGAGTPPLSADLSQSSNGRLGMIYIVAKDDWTKDGERVAPGKYRGAVQVTVTADQP
jgi:hypothetical protein